MAISTTHKETNFGVGDVVRVYQKIQEGEKARTSVFEGMVMGIKGHAGNKTFMVRRVGAQKIGIEQIFPLTSPSLEKIEVKRQGMKGARQAKLYFTRTKSKREIEQIYSRASRRSSSN
jgi:large subunit ribosomal protein L19